VRLVSGEPLARPSLICPVALPRRLRRRSSAGGVGLAPTKGCRCSAQWQCRRAHRNESKWRGEQEVAGRRARPPLGQAATAPAALESRRSASSLWMASRGFSSASAHKPAPLGVSATQADGCGARRQFIGRPAPRAARRACGAIVYGATEPVVLRIRPMLSCGGGLSVFSGP
jgi:hypothetical protein